MSTREHALGVVGAVPELGYLELHVAHGGLERPGAVAVAAVLPAVAALVAARAAHLLGLGVHQRVHHAAQHPARELARVAALLPKPRRLEGLVAAEAQYTLFLGHRLSFHSSPSLLQRRILGGVPSLSRKRRGGACPASYTTSLRATSGDPVYLKDAPLSKNSADRDEPMKASAAHRQRGPRPKQTLTHSARYLETPKQGKPIFVSSSKRRKQHRLTILLLIIVAIAVALVIRFIFFK